MRQAALVGIISDGVIAETTILARFCRHCAYNLYGLPENRCPECGKAFDLNDPKSYWPHASSLSRRKWAKRIVKALFTLLILCSVAGLSLWYPWHREQDAVQMVQHYGGGWQTITLKEQPPGLGRGYGQLCGASLQTTTIGPRWLQWLLGKRGGFLLQRVDAICPANSPVTDADLALWSGLRHLRSLNLFADSKLTDAGLVNLKVMKQLQVLGLDSTQVTDTGLVNLKHLKQLQWLLLGHTQVTDAGLVNFKELKQLQGLDLDATQVADAGLVNLKCLDQLQWLNLDGTHITNAGLANLKELRQLRWLILANTPVTDAGVSALQKALPNCHIMR